MAVFPSIGGGWGENTCTGGEGPRVWRKIPEKMAAW
jgi:hypothetical protein